MLNCTPENMQQLYDEKNQAYLERNKLVAALTKVFPSWLGRHEIKPGEEWDPEWLNVVYMDLPTGQASWHIHKDHLQYFEHLQYMNDRKWDGHSTEEKYARLRGISPITGIRISQHQEAIAALAGHHRYRLLNGDEDDHDGPTKPVTYYAKSEICAKTERVLNRVPDPYEIYRVILMASYCGGEGRDMLPNGCTDTAPCQDCLDMCNVADIVGKPELRGSLEAIKEREGSRE